MSVAVNFTYAEPRRVQAMDKCWFYHSMDIPGRGSVEGHWDLRNRFDEYVGGISVKDRTLLDVGVASGFLTFEAEKRGATVTGFDAENFGQYQHIPTDDKPDHSFGFELMRNGYWLAHEANQSKSKVVYGDIYSMSEHAPKHDIVLIGQILVHLRDPIEVLRQASLLAKDFLIVSEGSYSSEQPTSVFLGSKTNWYSWWHLSDELYRRWFDILGFEMQSVTKSDYICTQTDNPGEIWTFVGRRKQSSAAA